MTQRQQDARPPHPEGLIETAGALSNLGNTLVGWERPRQEIETAYRDAAAAGREAAIPAGLVLAAQALFNLGVALASWGATGTGD